jgi:hypothetical protein
MRLEPPNVQDIGRQPNRLLLLLLALASCGALSAASATAASATTYCVASAPNCTGTAEPTPEAALTKADADTTGSDTIVLPAATFSDPSGFLYNGRVPLEIDGQGETSTILTTAPGDNNSDLLVVSGSTSATLILRSLGLEIPASTDGVGGLFDGSATATIENVAVTSAEAAGSDVGLDLDFGGSILNSTVSVPTNSAYDNTAVRVQGPSLVQDSTMVGRVGLDASSATAVTLHRVVAVGATSGGAAIEIDSGQAQIDDSLLEADQGAIALYNDAASQVTGRQLTIAGDSQSIGVETSGSSTDTLALSDSIVAEPLAHALEINGQAPLLTDHDDYDHSSLPSGFTPGPGDLPAYVAPVFANPSNGDFRLLASSPSALFAADSTIKEAGESTTDLIGLPRFNDAARDLGAYQHQTPTVSAAVGTPNIEAGTAASFTATGGTNVPNDPLTYRWTFDDGQSASGASVAHAFTSAGTHTATVTVTDALGFTATATASVSVTAAPAAAAPSDAFTIKASGAAKAGVVTLRLATHAPGTATIKSSFSEIQKVTTGKGKHRKTRRVRRSVTYARATTAKVGSGDALSLKLKPTPAALRHLRAVKHEMVTVTAQFTPTGGKPATRTIIVSV